MKMKTEDLNMVMGPSCPQTQMDLTDVWKLSHRKDTKTRLWILRTCFLSLCVCAPSCLLFAGKVMTNLKSILKSRDKGLYSQSYGFSGSHVRMWELEHKEGWVPKNWCFQIAVMEKNLESPLDFKDIKPVNLKGNLLWIFIGRTVAEAEVPILWLPDVKGWLLGKDSDAGKDWRQKENGVAEMVR